MKLVDGQSKNINGGSRLKAELTKDSQTKKCSDVTRVVIGRKSVLYQSTKHVAELKLSHHLPIWSSDRPFSGLLSSFFSLIKSGISEQASR